MDWRHGSSSGVYHEFKPQPHQKKREYKNYSIKNKCEVADSLKNNLNQ
jgi:hypothetical protein